MRLPDSSLPRSGWFRAAVASTLLLLLLASAEASGPAPRAPEDQRYVGNGGHPLAPRLLENGIDARHRVGSPLPVAPKGFCGIMPALARPGASVNELRLGSPVFEEVEPNETASQATYYPLSTEPGLFDDVTWTGDFGELPRLIDQNENDDSTALANPTRLAFDDSLTIRQRAQAEGTLGDGLWGNSSGDYDFFAVPLSPGAQLGVEVVPAPGSGLDPVVGLYDRFGNLLVLNDNRAAFLADPSAEFYFINNSAQGQTFYVCVAGRSLSSDALAGMPDDATTDDTGPGAANLSQGDYIVRFGVNAFDRDVFKVSLRAGDVISLRTTGAADFIYLHDDLGQIIAGSRTEASGIYPAASPLLRGGVSTFAYVIPETGVYHLGLLNAFGGDWQLDARVRRPGPETDAPGYAHQIIFLDFDGGFINLAEFGGPNQQRFLSPFSDFFSRFLTNRYDVPLTGPYLLCALPDDDDNPDNGPFPEPFTLTNQEAFDVLKRKIIERFVAVMQADLEAFGGNGSFLSSWQPGEFRITVLNSFDHVDLYGQPNVSKVVIGGTVEQFGVDTVGLASAVDPGNFSRTDLAVVLLDTLTDIEDEIDTRRPTPLPNPLPYSLNSYKVTVLLPECVEGYEQVGEDEEGNPIFQAREREDIIEDLFFGAEEISTPFDLVAAGIANIAAHEAVHFLGGFHTTGFNDLPAIIDEGPGGLPNIMGLGDDLFWGPVYPLSGEGDPAPADDIDVLNYADTYSFSEGFFGTELIEGILGFGLSSGTASGVYRKPRYLKDTSKQEDTVVAVTGNPTTDNVVRVRPQLTDRAVRVTVNGSDNNLTEVDELWVIGGAGDDVFNSPLDTSFNGGSPDPRINIRVAGSRNGSLGDRLNFEPNGLGYDWAPTGPGRGTVFFNPDSADDPRLEYRGIETFALPNEISGIFVR